MTKRKRERDAVTASLKKQTILLTLNPIVAYVEPVALAAHKGHLVQIR
jgi:hypothetical protein